MWSVPEAGLHDLERGRLDIVMEAYFADERARYAWFSIPYNPGRTSLWVRKIRYR
jgi:polar amino acid transport system substrate-binding protein